MKPLRFALLAVLVAALLVFVPAASADCPPGDPECELLPPESEEVNPDPGSGLGSLGEIGFPGAAMPVQAVIPMPLPAVAEATLPRTPGAVPPSFSKLEVPLRYQQPGDVSCGVQALGMALDGLGGAAPTSTALLGFLQGNGMMYDYGTGVEELAYAAQSFGYRGSYAFHGASLEGLAARLAGGTPVVVSLGANGEGEPGHFVTVTGVSPDGRWVAYNDPTLGEQVISVEKFTRLWGLQGNSGVAVLKEVPPGAPDYSGYVALMAGLMALISMTPLGAKRYGVGGRVDSGGGGGGKVTKSAPKPAPAPARKPAPAPAPKAAPKPAPAPKPATVATPAPRVSTKEEKYGGEPAIAPVAKPTAVNTAVSAPAPKSTSPEKYGGEPAIAPASKPAPVTISAPKARFDEEPLPAPKVTRARFDEEPAATAPKVTKARFDAEPLVPMPKARFDEEALPTPKVTSAPTKSAKIKKDENPPPPDSSGTSWLWRAWDAVVDFAGKAVEFLAEHAKIGPVTLPVAIPRGFGLVDEGAVVLYRVMDEASVAAVRSAGRGVDEVLGPLAWPAGWALTVAPSQIENEALDAPMYEREADLELDTYGLVLSEVFGDLMFLATVEAGPVSVLVGAGADIGAGLAYDLVLDRTGFREAYVEANKPRPDETSPEPIPTPGSPTLSPAATPAPPGLSVVTPQATATQPASTAQPEALPVPEP